MAQIGKPTPAALAELKQRVLWSLSKLSDRDTQQYAVEDLIAIVDRLTVDAIPTFLSCLYDTDLQQKSYARKESVRLLGIMAAVHGRLLAPHLTKMIANVVQHFKDQDSKVRDACAEAMGVIAAEAFAPDTAATDSANSLNPLGVFFRPLFEAMNEQNRNIQLTAAASLNRVIRCTNVPLASSLPRLCPRIAKSLSTASFMAKGPLLDAVGSLFEAAGPDSLPFVPMLLGPTLAAFTSPDWMTRKAAAHAVQQLATSMGPLAVIAYKETVVAKLEKHRFDKVKAVREAISEALEAWKEIDDAPRATSYSQYRLKHGRPSMSAELPDYDSESPSVSTRTLPDGPETPHSADTSTPESKRNGVNTPNLDGRNTPVANGIVGLQSNSVNGIPLNGVNGLQPTSVNTPNPNGANRPSSDTPTTPRTRPSSAKRPPSSGPRVKRTSIRELRQASPGVFGGSGDKWSVEVAVPKSARYVEPVVTPSGGPEWVGVGLEAAADESRRRLDLGPQNFDSNGREDPVGSTGGDNSQWKQQGETTGTTDGEVGWERGTERAQMQERKLDRREYEREAKQGGGLMLEMPDGGESPIELVRNKSTRWMDSSMIRSGETVPGEGEPGASPLPGAGPETFDDLRSAESGLPNGDSSNVASAISAASVFDDAPKLSPRERRKWGQPEAGQFSYDPQFGTGELSQDLGSTRQTDFSPLSTGHLNPLTATTGPVAGTEVPGNGDPSTTNRPEFEQGVGRETWGGVASGNGDVDGRDWAEMKEQLTRLERQQALLLTMLQDVVSRSQTSIQGVESRVTGMERRLEEALSRQPTNSTGGGATGAQSPRTHDGAFASPQGIGRWGGTRISNPLAHPPPATHPEHPFTFRPSPLREQLTRRTPDEPSPDARAREALPDHETRFPYLNISPEGPPGYPDVSVPLADTQLGATRGYADVSNGAPAAAAAFERSPSASRRTSGGGTEAAVRGAKAWSAAVEWLRHGKVEEAYLEVLSLGDELQLIRLLGRTGPVLSQLTAPTAAEVICILAVLLKQESFLDVILPWMHQLADRANDDLLPRGLQREVVWALQVIAAQPTLSGSEAAKLVTTLCALWAPAFVGSQ